MIGDLTRRCILVSSHHSGPILETHNHKLTHLEIRGHIKEENLESQVNFSEDKFRNQNYHHARIILNIKTVSKLNHQSH